MPARARGCLAVSRDGRLGLITRCLHADLMGTDQFGRPWRDSRPIILRRLGDFLASGRSLDAWCKDRGFSGRVSLGSEARLIGVARWVGAC